MKLNEKELKWFKENYPEEEILDFLQNEDSVYVVTIRDGIYTIYSDDIFANTEPTEFMYRPTKIFTTKSTQEAIDYLLNQGVDID